MPKAVKHIVIDARNRRSSTGRYTDRLLENLAIIDKTNRYTVLVEPGDDWKPRSINFRTEACPIDQFSFSPMDQLKFAHQLRELQPDLVHFTMTQQPVFYFGNIITTTHDLTMLKYTRPSRFPAWLHKIGIELYKFLFWEAHKKSKKIIVPSHFVADDLAKYQPSTKGKIVVIHEASDPPSKLKPMAVAKVSEPFLLHVGSAFPHKNLDKLILAFDEVKKTRPDLKLVLAGKFKDQFNADLRSWIENSPNKADIITPGFVNEPELKWLYENAEMYVLPSLSEGFGLPGLEAMAHDCPVVASDNTCLPEIFGDGAEYFDPNNIQQMATVIEKILISKSVRDSLIKRGKDQANKYSWRETAKQTLNVYAKVLD